MNVPATWRGVRKRLLEAPEDVQWYFQPVGELIENYPWEVSLSYMFARLERAHLMALYCGVVKLHGVDSKLAREGVNAFENRPEAFRTLYKDIFGKNIPKGLVATLERAQNVRNNILHGKDVTQEDFRKAIISVIEYAGEFNERCYELGGFRPFGRLQGFRGAGASLDKSTSRWVLKGIGLPLS